MSAKKRTAKTTDKQFDLMLDFFENPQMLITGKLRPGEGPQKIQQLWGQLTETLKSSGSGPQKSDEGWKKTWNEYKSHVKKRARELKVGQTQTGGGEADKKLSVRDERLLGLISRVSIDGLEGVSEPGLLPIQIHPNPNRSDRNTAPASPIIVEQCVLEPCLVLQTPTNPESPKTRKRARSPSPGPSNYTPKSKKKAPIRHATSAAEKATSAYADAMAGRNNELAKNTEALKELASSICMLATAMQAVADSMLLLKNK